MANKEKNEIYYDNLQFLVTEKDDNQKNNELKKNLNIPLKNNTSPNLSSKKIMTMDSMTIPQVSLEKASQAILNEGLTDYDSSVALKSSAQLALESPELNKKLRIHQEYQQSKSTVINNSNSKPKGMNDILYQQDFDIKKFKGNKNETNKLFLYEAIRIYKLSIESPKIKNEIEPKQKIYRIKKQIAQNSHINDPLNKTISNTTSEDVQPYQNNPDLLNTNKKNKNEILFKNISIAIGSTMFSLLLLFKFSRILIRRRNK